eukprot:gene31981-39486_t
MRTDGAGSAPVAALASLQEQLRREGRTAKPVVVLRDAYATAAGPCAPGRDAVPLPGAPMTEGAQAVIDEARRAAERAECVRERERDDQLRRIDEKAHVPWGVRCAPGTMALRYPTDATVAAASAGCRGCVGWVLQRINSTP